MFNRALENVTHTIHKEQSMNKRVISGWQVVTSGLPQGIEFGPFSYNL